ncbi:toxin glutamine deamidase domain-containing protein [Streptomyces sp. CC224E]|uniref:toxin glutamine deamidase domain-containing protein n=1 Tax=Streptomyces sp. CC224E TaxID=3044174 RepID=UPI00278BC7F7|nr:toxin glutamine deamidase domain-containing protein [Streptomyces sp. CC224E]
MMLPDELAWLLEMLGFDWPTANEDHMMQCAATWRDFGAQVADIQTAAVKSAGNVTSDNYGEAVDAFVEKWQDFSGGSGYLDDARQAAEVIAQVFDVAAILIIGMKIAVIIQLTVLAIQIAVAAATAVVTFGISGAASAALTQVTRVAVRKILKEAAQALLEAALEAVKEPFVSALEEMSKDLVAQTVNQNFGAQDGYNLGRTASAGKSAVKDGFDNFGSTLGESLRDGGGGRAGHHARGGLDSAAGDGSSPSGTDTDAGSSPSSDSGSGAGDSAANGAGSVASSDGGRPTSSGSNAGSGGGARVGESHAEPADSAAGGTGGSPSGGAGGAHTGSVATGVGTQAGSGSDAASTPAPSPAPSSDRPLTPFDAGYHEQQAAAQSTAHTEATGSPASSTTPGSSPSGPPSGSHATPDASPSPQHQGSEQAAPAAASTDQQQPIPHARAEADARTPDPASTPTPEPTPAGQHDPTRTINTSSESAPTHDPNNPPSQAPSPTPGSDQTTATDPRTQTPQPITPTTPTTPTGTPAPTGASTPTTAPGLPPNQTTGPHTGHDSHTPTRTSTPTFHAQSTTATATETPTPTRQTPAPTPTPHSDANPTAQAPNQAPPHTAPATPTTPAPGPSRPATPTPQPRTDTPHRTTPAPDRPTSTRTTPAPTPTPTRPTPTPASQTNPNPHTHTHTHPQTPAPGPTGIYTVPTPNQVPNGTNSTSPQAGSTPPASPPTTPPTPNRPAPLSQGQSLQDLRDRLYQEPHGGLRPPAEADQQAVADAVPRNPDGTPKRHPSLSGLWARLINDHGINQPGRSNNCLDNARAGLSTWFGNPQVSAPRSPDLNPDGTPDRHSPERDSYNNLDAWAGRPQIWAGSDHPNPYARIAHHLQDAGPGSAAVVGVQWPGGGGHAFNVYNDNGRITWVDHQTGEISPNPIHTGATDVRYVPFDPGGQLMDAPWEKQQQDETASPSKDGADSTKPDPTSTSTAATSTSTATAPTPTPTPAAATTPAPADYGAPSPQPAGGNGSSGGTPPAPTAPSPGNSRPHPVREGPGQRLMGLTPEGVAEVDAQRAQAHDEAAARPRQLAEEADQRAERAQGLAEKARARGDDARADKWEGTREKAERAAEDARARIEASRPEPLQDDEREGLPPDAAQDRLRESHPVYRIEHDEVDRLLNEWADPEHPDARDNISPLAQVLRTADGESHPNAAPRKPTTFTRDGLARALPGFSQLNRGEQMHVVSTLARLSQSVHHEYGVGNNPGESHDKNSPIGGLKARIERLPQGVQEKADELGLGQTPHIPDLGGVNYAVIEVERNGVVEYVVDSSVPQGEDISPKPKHSEDHLLDWIKDNPEYEVRGLYTEREPCGEDRGGRGSSNCADLLGRRLGKDVPVYYSTAYRAHPSRAQEREEYRDAHREEFKKQHNIEGSMDAAQRRAFDRQVMENVPLSRQEQQISSDFNRHIKDKTEGLWNLIAGQLR